MELAGVILSPTKSKEIIEQTIFSEKNEKFIEMSQTVHTKSILCDDQGLFLENQKNSSDLENNIKIGEQNDVNKEKEKNNTSDNDKKEKDDDENKQLVEIDNIKKSIENAEKDNSIKMDDGNNDNTQVDSKPLENANLKEKDDHENKQLMEIDNVEKSIKKNSEKDLPAKINNENDGNSQMRVRPQENANLQQNDYSENENKDEKTVYQSVDQQYVEIVNFVDKDFVPTLKDVKQSNINEEEVNKNNEKKKIDNVSNIENYLENKISLKMDVENDDNTPVEKKPLENANLKENNNDDKEKTKTDIEKSKISENEKNSISHNAEELELGVNMIEDTPKTEGNEQKSEYNADKNADEQEVILDNSKDIQKKKKNEDEDEDENEEDVIIVEDSLDKSERYSIHSKDEDDNLEESVQKRKNGIESEDEQDGNNDNPEKPIIKKRKIN